MNKRNEGEANEVVGSFGSGGHYNPDEPRDEKGRWIASGLGKTPSQRRAAWRRRPLFDMSGAGRGASLLHHAVLSLPDRARRRFEIGGPEEGARLGRLIDRWNGASALDDETFQDQFLENKAPLETVRALRVAAKGAAQAWTDGDMADASKHLATAIQDVGHDRWPRFIKAADEIAANQPVPDKTPEPPKFDPSVLGAGFLASKGADQWSFLRPLGKAALAALSALARAALAAVEWVDPVLWLGLIFVPFSKMGVKSGDLPDGKGTYRLDGPAGTLNITIEGRNGGLPVTLVAYADGDGLYRDREGRAIARDLDGSVLIDPDAVKAAAASQQKPDGDRDPKPFAGIDDEGPKLCPAPGPDQKGGIKQRALDYQNYIATRVNPDNPMISTMADRLAIALRNPVTGNIVKFDDCFRRNGVMVEAKGPGYAELLQNLNKFPGLGAIIDLLDQAERQTQAAQGRKIIWYFAEEEARDIVKRELDNAGITGIDFEYEPMPGAKGWRSKEYQRKKETGEVR